MAGSLASLNTKTCAWIERARPFPQLRYIQLHVRGLKDKNLSIYI